MVVGQPPVFTGEDQCVESASAAPGRDAFGGVNAPHLCGSSKHEGGRDPAFLLRDRRTLLENTADLCCGGTPPTDLFEMEMLTASEHLDTSSEWTFTHRNRQH